MKVLLNGSVSRRGETILAERFGDRFSIALTDKDDAPDDRAAKFAEAEIIVSTEYTQDMPSAPAARLLHLPNSGLDAVDMAAVPDGCAVCNCYEHEVGISEYVMAGILDWTVGLAEFDGRFRGGAWDDSPRFSAPYRGELPGKVLASIGYGNIGRAVAARARAFGMVVHALTRSPRDFDPPPDWQGGMAKLDEMLPGADFVVVCCPLTDETRGMIDSRRLSLMKKTAILINVCRGPVVDEDALYAACRDGTIGGAVIDVWYQYADPGGEVLRPTRHPLHDLSNVVMTPHLSGWTDGLMPRRFAVIGDNIERLLAGERLVHQVHP